MSVFTVIDLIVYGLVGFLMVIVIAQHRRIHRPVPHKYGWLSMLMTWIMALFAAVMTVGAKYTFAYLDHMSAHHIIKTIQTSPASEDIKINIT